MSQVNVIRKQLLKGNTLTQRSALMDFGIMALPRRIRDLKETGFPVKTEMRVNPQTGQRYAAYSMDRDITSLSQLRAGRVYRVHSVNLNVFNAALFREADGYFTALRDGQPGDHNALVSMAGHPQMIIESNLTDNDFKISYEGGEE